jgi:acyl-Coa thioesterase superfamily protein/acyl-CoA thioesterase superfamily protein
MTDAFFIPDGDRFAATDWTRGPWEPGAQHAGPPSALLGRAFESLEGDMRVARVTVEILRPIPVAPLRIDTRLVRPGKRVQYAEAELIDGDETVARASAWRIRPSERPVPEAGLDDQPPPGPDGLDEFQPEGGWPERTYMAGMEWRFAHGAFFSPGPAAAWMRMRLPLVRVLAAADSGNGISQVVPMSGFLFVNTELSVHLVRMPAGEWVCLDAVTRVASDGVGLAESVLWDERGRIGGGRQSLLVAPR